MIIQMETGEEGLRRLRLALSLPSHLPIDADAGLARLLERIEASAPPATPIPVRLPARRVTRGLLAAVLMIQAVGITLVASRLWPANPVPAYRTLSEQPIPAVAGTIRVVPDAAMALTDWNALLHILRLRVVGGPDAAGAYTVAPLSATSTTRHTLQQLRATRGVKLAEPVTAAR